MPDALCEKIFNFCNNLLKIIKVFFNNAVIIYMAEIKINLASFNSYLKDNNVNLSENDVAQLNSIFTQCDTINENGEQEPDGKLTGDEVPTFQRLVMEKLSNIANYVMDFINSLANPNDVKNQSIQQPQMPQIQQVECHRTQKEQEEYIAKFEEARSILINNAETLGLSQEEINYINKIEFESISQGPARYDREKDQVFFNINDKNPPEVGGFVKIIMHEITHGVLKNTNYTQAQELACETRGITVAKKLYDSLEGNDKEKFNFHIYQNLSMTDLKDDNDVNNYLNNWIKNYSYLPKE